MLEILFFIVGVAIGSFLNVCIYRLPRKESVVSPSSHCPHCEKKIPFYFNIPIISYLWLKGKCFYCKSKISLRYLIVELLSGILTLLSFVHFGLGIKFIFYSIFTYFLITIAFIDLDTKQIYNKLLAYLIIFGIVANLFLKIIPWNEALLGVAAGGSFMILIFLLGHFLFHKESLGMGDVKFIAVAGFFLGWKMIIIATFFGFACSLPVLIGLMIKGKLKLGEYVPLGPFLAVALVVFVFWGRTILDWYLQLFTSNVL